MVSENELSEEEAREKMMAQQLRIGVVQFHGLKNTNPVEFNPAVAALMDAKTFGEAIEAISIASSRLKRLDVFKSVQFKLDKSQSHDGEMDVHINVVEKGRFELRTETQIGNQEGDLVISGKIRNCAGRAEVISGVYSVGTLTTSSFQLSVSKPLPNHCHSFDVGLYKTIHNLQSIRSHHEVLRGLSLNYKRLTSYGEHAYTYNATWRELGPAGNDASWAVRRELGDTVKSSVTHTFTRDLRNSPTLTTGGYKLVVTQEIAGLGGDVSFLKTEGGIQKYALLHRSGLTLAVSARAGLLWPTSARGNDKKKNGYEKMSDPTTPISGISDRFFLGGPMSIRGFNMMGVGPREKNDALGGDAFWEAGVSLRTPIPLVKNTIGDSIQLHSFLNAGSIARLGENGSRSGSGIMNLIMESPLRASTGLGVMMQLGPARLELNYCVPLAYATTDSKKQGFQLGVGVNFL
eukprot:CFRG1211T1